MNKEKLFDAFICAGGGLFGFLFGEVNGLFYALTAFILLDYLSGVMKAIYLKKLSSEVGFRGICKKVTIFIIVAVANIIDVHIIKDGSVMRSAVMFLFIANEGISLLENAGELGVPVPEKLLDVLKQLRADNSKNADKSVDTYNKNESED